ncbi:Uncharacterised protein [Citrobacter koseri]|nr:Uncharacterised protein [Citrobacter koseri]
MVVRHQAKKKPLTHVSGLNISFPENYAVAVLAAFAFSSSS